MTLNGKEIEIIEGEIYYKSFGMLIHTTKKCKKCSQELRISEDLKNCICDDCEY